MMGSAVLIVGILLALSMFLVIFMLLAFSMEMKSTEKKLIGFLYGAAIFYMMGYALELCSSNIEMKIFFNHVQYLGIVWIAPLWYLVSVQYRFKEIRLSPKGYLLLLGVPLITMIGNFATGPNGWLYAGYSIKPWENLDLVIYGKSYGYYIHAGFQSVMAAMTMFHFYKAARNVSGIERIQSAMLFLISLSGCISTFLGCLTPYTSEIDTAAVLIGISSVLLLITLVRYELFELLPYAYRSVFEHSENPIMILGDSLQPVRMNASAKEAFADEAGNLQEAFMEEVSRGALAEASKGREYKLTRNIGGELRHFTARISGLEQGKRSDFGYLLTFYDVTSHINTVQNLKAEAFIDPLTGVYNRRYFFRHAEKMMKRARHEGISYSVIMIDIDRFKEANDRYGHMAGDYILKSICEIIKSQLRETDVIARFGGEEFIILLSATKLKVARAIAERLCESVRSTEFCFEGETMYATISVGLSTISPSGEISLDRCISLADGALYRAKEEGRDRVCHC